MGGGPSAVKLICPFCGAAETERLEVEEKLVVIFPCMFSPLLDPSVPEEGRQAALAEYAKEGTGYFQKQCDRLHYFVTKGAGSVFAQGSSGASPPAANEP